MEILYCDLALLGVLRRNDDGVCLSSLSLRFIALLTVRVSIQLPEQLLSVILYKWLLTL